MNTNNIEHMSDDDLLKEINVYDPYDVEFARRFRVLAARVAELEVERDQWAKQWRELLSAGYEMKARAEAAEAKLATARTEALEEAIDAAHVADSLELALHGSAAIVDRIRALIPGVKP